MGSGALMELAGCAALVTGGASGIGGPSGIGAAIAVARCTTQFYFQQGAKTIYQARSVSPTAALPARLKVVRGTYRVLVRPAVPSDAGIILGGAMFEKTLKL